MNKYKKTILKYYIMTLNYVIFNTDLVMIDA